MAGDNANMVSNWAYVADQVTRRRTLLRLSQRRAAIESDLSPTTWASLETHHNPVNQITKGAMAEALRWVPDALDRLLAGEEPDESWDVRESREPTTDERLSALEVEVREIRTALAEHFGIDG